MTPMDLFVLIVVVVTPWVGMILRERARHGVIQTMQEMVRCEENRNRFGKLRTDLRRAHLKDPDTFQELWFETMHRALTELMRKPQDYAHAVGAVLATPRLRNRDASDRPRMSREDALIANRFAEMLDLLCRDFSQTYRIFAWVFERLPGSPSRKVPLWVLMKRPHLLPVSEAADVLREESKLVLAAA